MSARLLTLQRQNMDDGEERRVITSAIDGMSVAEVRRALATMRRSWEEASSGDGAVRPFYMTHDPLVRGHSVQKFSYMFVRGHHAKRLSKNRSTPLMPSRPETPPGCSAQAAPAAA
jgi:hypothetical protein